MTKTKKRYEVQTRFICGWSNEWMLHDEQGAHKQTFDSREEAEKAIDEFISDQHEAFTDGHMAGKYPRSDYRVRLVSLDDVVL